MADEFLRTMELMFEGETDGGKKKMLDGLIKYYRTLGARRLAAEEAKEKPTAPASVMGVDEKLAKELVDYACFKCRRPNCGGCVIQSDIVHILSRYRPASQTTDEGLREDIEKVALDTISPPIPEVLKEVLVDRIMVCISRHPSPSQGLVGELKEWSRLEGCRECSKEMWSHFDEIIRKYEGEK